MASHGQQTIESPDPPDFAPGAQFVEYEEFIESQLRRTRSHVRSVDLAAGFMVLLTGTLAYFLVVTLVDHWLISGGLGFWGRLLLLAGFVAGAGWWIVTQILPSLIKRINPLFAAYTIERSRPTLKNSLVNFLLFRADPSGVHQRVLEAIEEQAATNLVGVQVDSAVDRSRLIKLGYVLVGILALCALYAVASPKNLFQTVGRVVMPWADIQPPTRTTIDEIEPGDVQAFRGQQVTVKARVQGVADDAPVTLYYTTADKQIVDRPVEMSRPAGEYRYTAVLPAADAELQQSLTYTIKAGDATSRTYSIEVVAAPTIVVKSIEYKYPGYTGLLSQRVEHQGDLKAIEGTEVTLEALANQEIASGYVDFDANHTLDLPLRGEGAHAKASFRLLLKEDRQTPEHDSYQLTFKNAAGQQNPQPVRHQIEVTRDLSPEIQFVSPNRDEVELPIDGAIDLEVVANDPDFALANVKLLMAKGDKRAEEKLLNATWRGQFVKKYHFQPSKLRLAVGDTIEYWAVAVDNKSPRANQTETARRKIVIVAPAANADGAGQSSAGGEQAAGGSEKGKPGDEPSKGAGEQAPGDETSPKADAAGEPKPGAAGESPAGEVPQANDTTQDATEKSPEQKRAESGKSQAGEGEPGADGSAGASQAGDSGEPQAGDKPAAGEQADGGAPSAGEQGGEQQEPVASDGTNDGDAFERILQDREEQAKQQPQDGEKQQGEQPQGGDDQQSGDQQSGEQPQGGEQNSGEQQAGQKQAGDKQSGAGEQSQPQNGKQQGGQKGGPEEQGEGQQPGQSQGGNQQGGQQQGAQKSAGQKAEGSGGESQQPSEKSDGAQGDGQAGKAAGEKSPDGKQAGAQGNKQDGAKGNKQPGDAQAGQKSDDKQSGQKGQGQKPGKSDPNAGANDGGKGSEKSADNKNADQPGDPNAQPSDTKGQGAQSKGDSNAGGQQKPSGNEKPDARGGDGEAEKGESGAGQESEDKQGSPGAQEANQPRDKSQPGKQQGGEKKDGEEQSPSISKRESDTEGDEDGDRSGGGQRGGGQKANQSGTGGAGQNTAADEGADRSQQAGGSETSGRAGEDQAADGKTGKSGKQTGPGSQQRPATDENGTPGGEQTQPSDGSKSGSGQKSDAGEGQMTESAEGTPTDRAGEQRATDSQKGQPSSEPGDGSEQSQAGGQQKSAGGTRSDGSKSSQEVGVGNPDENSEGAEAAEPNGQGSKSLVPPKRDWEAGTDKADQANLEYSSKATDLAIEHLQDQLNKGQADPKLLDRLGWTRQDAEKFVERWQAMRSGAQAADKSKPGGKRQLDEALRSLGLHPRGTTLSGSAARDDRTQGLEESRRTKPPAEYSEAFKAYTQGTTRGGK